ncbi:hypothetical protein V5O48_002447 [Marasmius crinis-equi]|uniref:Uncharacterized protein n=1 Tax=Marasmius crinis-equi TaxID=585013 RepID=A0ABR3FVQ1_9AGAR
MAVIDLTANTNFQPTHSLTGEDGRIGALHNDSFITCLFDCDILMPTPPSTENVQVDTHGKFGEHDFTVWPQWYSRIHPHHAIMPKKPTPDDTDNPYTPFLCMWADILDEDVDWVGNSALSGVGILRPALFQEFKKAVESLVAEAENFVKGSGSSPEFTKFIKIRVARLKAYRDRLTCSRADLLSMRITVTSLQRLWFDLKTGIRYMKVFQPMMNGELDSDVLLPGKEKFLGAFSHDLDVVEMCRLANIPIYYIRPVSLFSNQVILSHIDLEPHPKLELPSVTLPNVFVGPPDHSMKLFAIYQFGARFLATKYTPYTFTTFTPNATFGNSATELMSRSIHEKTSVTLSRTGPSRSQSTTSIKRHAEGRGGHPGVKQPAGKPAVLKEWFEDLHGTEVSPAIPTWKDANVAVNLHSSRFLDERQTKHLYSFPPPSLFTKAKPDRQDHYYRQLRHLRSALIFRVDSPFTNGGALSTQDWRNILSLHTAKESGADTYAKQNFATAKSLLGRCFELQGVHLDFIAAPNPIAAGERSRLLWELCELSFRNDLLRLDSHLRLKPSAGCPADDELELETIHEGVLLKIFPELSLTMVDIDLAPIGLSSAEWEHRRSRLINFRDLMAGWSVFLPEVLTGTPPGVDATSTVCLFWEERLIRHFVQLFFDVFGRPAVLPRSPPC